MRLGLLLLLGFAAFSAGGSQAAPSNPGPGPAVGARVPEFQLTDQNGEVRSLHSLMGPHGLMLVFFRSADW